MLCITIAASQNDRYMPGGLLADWFFYYYFDIFPIFLNYICSETHFQKNIQKTINGDHTKAHTPHV